MEEKHKPTQYNLSPKRTKELINLYNNETNEDIKDSIRDKILLGHSGICGKIAHNFSPQPSCFDDLFQIAFIALIEAFEKYDVTRKVPFHLFAWMVITRKLVTASMKNQYGWLAQLASHHQLTKKGDEYKQCYLNKKIKCKGDGKEKDLIDMMNGDTDTYLEVDQRDEWEWLIHWAKPHQRICIDKHYREGIQTKEIAKELGISISAVRQRIEIGRALIKKKLEELK